MKSDDSGVKPSDLNNLRDDSVIRGDELEGQTDSSFGKPLDRALLAFKTSKLEPYLDQLKSSKNLDIMQVLGRQILDRADEMKDVLSSDQMEQLKNEIQRQKVVREASRLTKETISKVFPAKKSNKSDEDSSENFDSETE